MVNFNKNKQGFTLLEILLVVAAISILAGIVIFAINPGKQLADTRNAQRRVDVNTILNAVHQYMIDNGGAIPSSISIEATNICRTGQSCTNLIDLSVLTNDEKYLTAIPIDPTFPNNESLTDYYIEKTSNGRITVSAPNAERGAVISVTR